MRAALTEINVPIMTQSRSTRPKFCTGRLFRRSSINHVTHWTRTVMTAVNILAPKILFSDSGAARRVSRVLFSISSDTVSITMLPARRAGKSMSIGTIME